MVGPKGFVGRPPTACTRPPPRRQSTPTRTAQTLSPEAQLPAPRANLVREVVDQERILVPGWPTGDLPSGDMNGAEVTSPLPFLLFVPRLSKLSAHSNKAILGCQYGRPGSFPPRKGVATLD